MNCPSIELGPAVPSHPGVGVAVRAAGGSVLVYAVVLPASCLVPEASNTHGVNPSVLLASLDLPPLPIGSNVYRGVDAAEALATEGVDRDDAAGRQGPSEATQVLHRRVA